MSIMHGSWRENHFCGCQERNIHNGRLECIEKLNEIGQYGSGSICDLKMKLSTTGPILCKNVQQKRPHYGRCITVKF